VAHFVVAGRRFITIWLNPDLGPGATEASQPENLITSMTADASFDEIRSPTLTTTIFK
jgi:hypothetical protein